MNHLTASTSKSVLLSRSARASIPFYNQACCSSARSSLIAARHASTAPPAPAKKESGPPFLEFVNEQAKASKLMQNRKTLPAVKLSRSQLTFTNYIPPLTHNFKPFTEDWLTYQAGRIMNWYQSLQATKEEFGLWSNKRRNEVIKKSLIPTYTAFHQAKASGHIPPRFDSRVSEELLNEIGDTSRYLQSRNYKMQWELVKTNKVTIVSARTIEMDPQTPICHLAVRFDTIQSLKVTDAEGNAVNGNDGKPTRVVENYVFGRTMKKDSSAPWKAIKALPFMTPLQAVGKQDDRFLALEYEKNKKPSVTVVA